jgi:hypothetical protein
MFSAYFLTRNYTVESLCMNFVTLYIAYEAAALAGQDPRRVVVLKIKDKDNNGGIAYTVECLLPFVPESLAFLFVF